MGRRSQGSISRKLVDSSAAFKSGCYDCLRTRLASDGYLLLRGLLPREACLQAYAVLCKALSQSRPDLLNVDGSLKPAASALGLLGRYIVLYKVERLPYF